MGGIMEIIFHGQQQWQELQDNISSLIAMLHDKYHINSLREINLSITLMDKEGFEVELMDTVTNDTYRVIEVYRDHMHYQTVRHASPLTLVVDNTKEIDTDSN